MDEDFWLGTKPLEAFYPALVRRKRIQSALKKEFGLAAQGIIDKLTAGIPLGGEESGSRRLA